MDKIMHVMKLATIGYEGFSISNFFTTLLNNHIETLIDIRELPLSRKPGFSKGALANQAANFNIHYIHLGVLGCPRNIRQEYRKDGNWERYTQYFLDYLGDQDREIERLLNIITSEVSCLLCFEANPYRCHRFYVANAVTQIAKTDFEIIHLEATRIPVVWLEPWADILTQQ
jgi:uncharacterized protein (DUF488 family)